MRDQHLSQAAPKTIHVVSEEYRGVTLINEDSFDPKTMKRVNQHGQLLDDKGAVIPEKAEQPTPAAPAANTAANKK